MAPLSEKSCSLPYLRKNIRVSASKDVASGIVLPLAAILVSIAYSTASASPTIYACVNRSTGIVRIVSGSIRCYGSEYETHWSVTGPTGPQGPKGATGATGPQGPAGVGTSLVDANAKQIGPFFPSQNGTDTFSGFVLISINGLWFSIQVTVAGFGFEPNVGNGNAQLDYTGANCDGPAYIGVPPTGLLNSGGYGAGVVGNVLYYGVSPVSCTSVGNFSSFSGVSANGNQTCENYSTPIPPCSLESQFGSPDTFDLSTLGFTPPFRLKVQGSP